MTSLNQQLESYVPVYDVVPENWEDARAFLVEQLKKITNSLNAKEIGWFIDDEIISGKQFIPATPSTQQFRTIFRKVIPFGPIAIGVNTQPHNITVNGNTSLIALWAAATDATAMTGEPIPNGSNTIAYDSTNIIITSTKTFTRAWAFIEYIQEL